ncbi:Receptor-type tyrosine-protein phosphatase N2, partial [Bienertia sinuspersici]
MCCNLVINENVEFPLIHFCVQAKFALGEGSHIDKALIIQCSSLYRHWRERLKSANFSKCKSLKEAERACPQRSEKNRANALSKKIQSACGAKSIARILYEMEVEAEASFEADNEGDSRGNASNFTASEQTQAVLSQFMHKDGSFDDDCEVKLNELKNLHEKEIQEKGIDSLSIDEAYVKMLGHCSGYAHGLGKGHPVVAKDGKKGKAELEAEIEQLRGDNTAMQAKLEFLIVENQRREKAAREKEEALEKKLTHYEYTWTLISQNLATMSKENLATLLGVDPFYYIINSAHWDVISLHKG